MFLLKQISLTDSLALNLRGRPRKLLVDGALVILTIPGTLLVSFHCRKLSVFSSIRDLEDLSLDSSCFGLAVVHIAP